MTVSRLDAGPTRRSGLQGTTSGRARHVRPWSLVDERHAIWLQLQTAFFRAGTFSVNPVRTLAEQRLAFAGGELFERVGGGIPGRVFRPFLLFVGIDHHDVVKQGCRDVVVGGSLIV
ncbi:hypothetical protein SAMN05428979_2555 [Stappia sp. ES.058]|nr:hypothetical protein SAMN05428979_2555 [Stappia sp. ES.058]